MTTSSQVERILALARALYQRGAVPEALAIAREVFVGLWGREELAELLPAWIRSLEPPPGAQFPSSDVVIGIGTAIDLLGPALDPADAIRALTALSTVQPISGAPLAARALDALRSGEHEAPRRWIEIPVELRSLAFGWEIASPVLNATRRQELSVPDDFALDIVRRLPQRHREPLSERDTGLVRSYARALRDAGQEEPGIRLAIASAVASQSPTSVEQVIEVVRPGARIREAAQIFGRRGYPTEAANVLMDSLEGGFPMHELRELVERGELPAPSSSAVVVRRSRGRSKKPTSSSPDKSFFLALEGEHVHRDQVVRDQDADLYFMYDIPSADAVAQLKSDTLTKLGTAAREGESLEIGVFVLPVGFRFRGNEADYKIATIRKNELQDAVVFKLRAIGAPGDDTGVTVVLTYNGAEVFQGFIRIAIVDALGASSTSITQLVVSKSAFDDNTSLPRDVTAFITTQDGQCRVSVRVGRELPKPPEVLNLSQLQSAILNARAAMEKVAQSPVFGTLTPGRWGAGPGQESAFLGALCRMMSAGSALYRFLREAQATSGLVEAIERQETGAKITIFTDSAFVPWEILFPRRFFSDAEFVQPDSPPRNFEPDELWGNRFEFETVLVFSNRKSNVQYPLRPDRRQPGTLNIRIGVGSVEPEPSAGTPADAAALNALAYHRAYCSAHHAVAHWIDGSDELKRAFQDSDYQVSLLYLVCHGKSTGTFEELDFGGYKPVPEWLDYERAYPGWPVVFINSCSLATPGPHVFDTFLHRFREKHAFGMVASSFPLPTRFATLFGCEFLDGYRGGEKLGALLLSLRQRLLEAGNPLAFFYALQCPLDVQRPGQPAES